MLAAVNKTVSPVSSVTVKVLPLTIFSLVLAVILIVSSCLKLPLVVVEVNELTVGAVVSAICTVAPEAVIVLSLFHI